MTVPVLVGYGWSWVLVRYTVPDEDVAYLTVILVAGTTWLVSKLQWSYAPCYTACLLALVFGHPTIPLVFFGAWMVSKLQLTSGAHFAILVVGITLSWFTQVDLTTMAFSFVRCALRHTRGWHHPQLVYAGGSHDHGFQLRPRQHLVISVPNPRRAQRSDGPLSSGYQGD